jgi:PiT family inorganic phosphate transporter
MTMCLYSVIHAVRTRAGINSTVCLCAGNTQEALMGSQGIYTIRSSGIRVTLEQEQYCRRIYAGNFLGINMQKLMDALHFLTAGAVCFGRGLNDTPKIAALVIGLSMISPRASVFLLAIAMAGGGIFHAKKVAHRMSLDITEMNPGQAFTGNLVTAILVTAGSLLGMPLSTTHVSCGAIFGIGVAGKELNRSAVLQILSAWITTAPLAMMVSAAMWYGAKFL